ncbi:MAG: DUF1697 domain-containing protein [Devosia sp.]
MPRYVVLLRGINVGGKNKVSMAALKQCVEGLGCSRVSTLLASGNIVLDSTKNAAALQGQIEKALPQSFKLDSELIRVLVLSRAKFRAMVIAKPHGFGEQPNKYHSDAIFLMGIAASKTMKVFDPREGIDVVWPGKGVIYSQRLSAKRTKSRLSRIVADPAYKSMTIRSWQTTLKLFEMLDR